MTDFEMDGTQLAILATTCEAADRLADARTVIDADGLTVEGRFGTKSHPSLATERDSRLAMWRGLRELGVTIDTSTPRPPSPWKGRQGRDAQGTPPQRSHASRP